MQGNIEGPDWQYFHRMINDQASEQTIEKNSFIKEKKEGSHLGSLTSCMLLRNTI